MRRGTLRALIVLILAAAALATALLSRGGRSESPIPSIDNAGPLGAKALFLALRRAGYDVRASSASLTALAADVRVLVIAAPEQREIAADEVTALQHFVRNGGTLVYLAPPNHSQPQLEAWLRLEEGPLLEPDRSRDDSSGVTVPVRTIGSAGPVQHLRVGADFGIEVPDGAPLASAGPVTVLSVLTMGAGQVWVGAGPDLIQNRRIELADNLGLWTQLAARGPMAFDELHHTLAPTRGSRALTLFALQLLLTFALFVLARATRLGPPRPALRDVHRPVIESAVAMARLTREARLEHELVAELWTRLRRTVADVTGTRPDVPDAELIRALTTVRPELGAETAELQQRVSSLRARPRVSPAEYLDLSQRIARLEQRLDGRSGARTG